MNKPMIPDWQTDRVYLSQLLPVRHPQLWHQLDAALRANDIHVRRLRGTKDIWLRDFCPVQVDVRHFVKFRYEPDYLRGHEHLITNESVFRTVPLLRKYIRSSINLDGGNVVASETKLILTEKVFKENPGLHRKEIRGELQRLFQVEECIFIPKEPYDRIGHADGIVRFINNDTVAINDYSRVDRGYRKRLKAILKRHRLEWEEVPYFVEKQPAGSAVGNYVNWLRMDKLIVVPAYGVPKDDAAFKKIEALFPGMIVVPLKCNEIAEEGGCWNCVSYTFVANIEEKTKKGEYRGIQLRPGRSP